jgi:hypothetical protein
MITLLHFHGDCMMPTVKKYFKIYIIRNRIMKQLNKFKYILLA